MKFIKFTVINMLPVLVIMTVIYTASSQTSEQQDISPVLDRVAGEDNLRSTLSSLRELMDGGADFLIDAAAARPLLLMGAFLFLSAGGTAVFFYFFQTTGSLWKKALQVLLAAVLVLAFTGSFLYALRGETVLAALRDTASFEPVRLLLAGVDFTYAGSQISQQTQGTDGLMEFFLRKGAHFVLFGLLGFFVYLALFKLSRNVMLSFCFTMLFVTGYAALDEYRQTFIDSRSGLVEDVFLDTTGGLFGTLLAWAKRNLFPNRP
ncbi:MAG: VanZ family protein [Alkalicoccus sp.]|nr:MAG: VanZ family protein [Alkalicoccus sp.]